MPTAADENEQTLTSCTFDGDIGICMSGGGYRAAAFHLGALAYLERCGLAAQIGAISTVSGGTFTGAKYVLSLVEGQSFDSFLCHYYHTLTTTNLVKAGLAELAARKNEVASGRQDLIVSMAQVYAEKMFCRGASSQESAEPYYFDSIMYGDQPIPEVVFNATDFRSGIAFRFQRSSDPAAVVGNFYNHIEKKDAGRIRLADIVAASSCFPGGFEPLSFPYDFTWRGVEIPETVRQAYPSHRNDKDPADPRGPVALMDGGVYDNQGLQSLLMADKRSENDLGLIIISDVDQPSIDQFDMPEPLGNGGLSLGAIAWGALIFMLFCTTTFLAIGYNFWQDWGSPDWLWTRFFFIYLIPFGLSAVAAGTILYVYLFVRNDILPFVPKVGGSAWSSLRRLTIGQLKNMLRLRVKSLLTLTSSIFMKRIRQLVYKLVYEDDSNDYAQKSVSNLIYSLAPSKVDKSPVRGVPAPSGLLDKVACVAFNQPTTLWFEHDYQGPCLVAAGQASLCYNLMKHISRRFGEDPALFPPLIKGLWASLFDDWKMFNEDPFFMLKRNLDEPWEAIARKVASVQCDWGMFEKQQGTRG